MAKANADYTRLADEAELLHDGLSLRVKRTTDELKRLLADVPNRAAIMQAFDRHAVNVANQREVAARLARYVALRDRPDEQDGKSS